MRNKNLIPFEVIEKAVAGETDTINAVLHHYTVYHPKVKKVVKGNVKISSRF